MTERYLFSVLNDELEGVLKNDCEITLMSTTEDPPRYVFRLTHASGVQYVNASEFPNYVLLIDIFLLRSVYVFRGLWRSGVPDIIRVFSKSDSIEQSLAINNLSSRFLIENEQALMNYMKASKIVIEPSSFFSVVPAPLGVPTIPKIRRWGELKHKITARRTLAPEQRSDAESMIFLLRVHDANPITIPISSQIAVSDSVEIDMTHYCFARKQPAKTTAWIPNGSFLTYTKGCGRRRTIASVMDAVTSMPIESPSEHQHLGQYFACRTGVIVCEGQKISKWKSELTTNLIVLQTREDYDGLTFQSVQSGCTILVTPEALNFAAAESDDAIQAVRQMTKLADPRARNLDDALCARILVSSISDRMPSAKVPMHLLRARCIVIDLPAPLDLDIQDNLRADWTWITLGYDGEPPSHLPARYAEWNSASDPIDSSFHPDLWRILHEPSTGFLQKLKMPKSILRRVSLIPMIAGPTENERAFLQSVARIQQSMTALPVAVLPLASVASALLGAQVNGVPACQLQLALPRSSPMKQEEAEKNLAAHFASALKGTLAQRVGSRFAQETDQVIPIGDLSESTFVQRALVQKGDGTCQVCFTDPVTTVTLCGHCYCVSCAGMLRNREARIGVTSCPVCRAALSSYDWITIGEPTNADFVPSKVRSIKSTLGSVFGRRRHKRRVSMCAWIVVPSEAIEPLREQLIDSNYEVITDPLQKQAESSQRQQIPLVRLILIDDLGKQEIDDSVEAILLSSPAPSRNVYHSIIRGCVQRSCPLQLYVFVSHGVENAEEAINTFL